MYMGLVGEGAFCMDHVKLENWHVVIKKSPLVSYPLNNKYGDYIYNHFIYNIASI